MGYRSEVRALIYGPEDKINAFLVDQAMIKESIVFKEFKEDLKRYVVEWKNFSVTPPKRETLHVIALYGDNWKWYKGYPDVEAWYAFMEESLKYDLKYEFVRIGEDPEDIEKLCSNDWVLLYITRPEVVLDFEPGEEKSLFP